MRSLAAILLIVALGGCTTIRETLGIGAKTAAPDGPANAAAAREKVVLRTDLGGDKANAVYTSTPQR